MNEKAGTFIFVCVGYWIIFLVRNDWVVSTKQIAEMICIGVGTGLVIVLMTKPTKRLIENVLKKMYPH